MAFAVELPLVRSRATWGPLLRFAARCLQALLGRYYLTDELGPSWFGGCLWRALRKQRGRSTRDLLRRKRHNGRDADLDPGRRRPARLWVDGKSDWFGGGLWRNPKVEVIQSVQPADHGERDGQGVGGADARHVERERPGQCRPIQPGCCSAVAEGHHRHWWGLPVLVDADVLTLSKRACSASPARWWWSMRRSRTAQRLR